MSLTNVGNREAPGAAVRRLTIPVSFWTLLLTVACRSTILPEPASVSSLLPIQPPALRQQIIHHINAYLTIVICHEAGPAAYSQFLAVASRNNDPLSTYNRSGEREAPCTTFNRVAEIP